MTQSDEPLLGKRVGQIRITEILGSGGMGTVYGGFHERLERKVAVKLIRAERRMSATARQRFLREARLLSRLNHPQVCRVHDLIDTPEGEILVLEYVEGTSLRERMREGLGHDEALGIARQLLAVLAAVHREGIVHRDLKPENVMVQPDGAIKVLDFGIARAAGTGPTGTGTARMAPGDGTAEETSGSGALPGLDPDALTDPGTLVGTLRFMSPEQARGEEATPASDVYAVALILLEMLTGKPAYPHDLPTNVLLTKIAWGDIEHLEELPSPVRPFVERLTSLSPADRPSARDAAERLDFILSAPQRRKKRLLVTATLALLAALTVGMTVQWVRASREAERARRSLAETREVSGFLEELFQLSNPFFMGQRRPPGQQEVPVQALLERGTRTIRERFADQPLTRARFMVLLGRIQRNLGHYAEASALLEEAVALRKTALAPEDPLLAEAFRELGETKRLQGRFEEAGRYLGEARAIEEAGGQGRGPAYADTLESLALLAEDQGRAKEALSMLQRVYALRTSGIGRDSHALALTLQRLGVAENLLGRYDDARRHLQQALEIVQKETGAGHPAMAALLVDLGNLETSAGQIGKAENDYREGLRIVGESLPATHPLRITLLTNLANTLESQGRLGEAAPLYREALGIMENTYGPDHIETGKILLNLAMLEHHQGNRDDAGRHFERAITILDKQAGPRHPATAMACLAYGALEGDLHHWGRAEELYSRALKIFRAALGPSHPYTAMALNNLGEIDRFRGRYASAEAYYRQALAIDEKALGPEDPSVGEILRGLAITRARLGDRAEAARLFDRAEGIFETAGQPLDQIQADRRRVLGGRAGTPASSLHSGSPSSRENGR